MLRQTQLAKNILVNKWYWEDRKGRKLEDYFMSLKMSSTFRASQEAVPS